MSAFNVQSDYLAQERVALFRNHNERKNMQYSNS